MKVKPKARVVLYSKPGCHLCEEMKEEMNRAGCSALYELEEVNIEDDFDLFGRYRYEIPVLSINGVEAFRYHLRADEFRNYVTALVNQSSFSQDSAGASHPSLPEGVPDGSSSR